MNATKIVLLLTIAGLVGASGYLIYKKLRPAPAVEVASSEEVQSTKPVEAAENPTPGPRPAPAAHPSDLPDLALNSEPLGQSEPDDELPLQPPAPTPGRQLPPMNVDELPPLGEEPTLVEEELPPAGNSELASDPLELPDLAPPEQPTQEPQLVDIEPVPAEPNAIPELTGNRATQAADSFPLELPELGPEEGSPTAGQVEPVQSQMPIPELADPEPLEPEPLEELPLPKSPTPSPAPTPRMDGWEPAGDIPRQGTRPGQQIEIDAPAIQPIPQPGKVRNSTSAPTGRKLSPVSSQGYVEEGTDPRSRSYIVQPGDNFWRISRNVYGTSRYFLALKKHNESRAPDPYSLRPGLELETPTRDQLKANHPELIDLNPPDLKTPRPRGNTSQVEPAGLFFSQDGEPLYRVAEDDTLSSISQKHLGRASRWPEIFDRNRNVLSDWETVLKPGMVLRLPTDASQLRVVGTP